MAKKKREREGVPNPHVKRADAGPTLHLGLRGSRNGLETLGIGQFIIIYLHFPGSGVRLL